MLIIVRKVIRGGVFNTIHRYAKDKINISKIMIKIKNHHILNIGM